MNIQNCDLCSFAFYYHIMANNQSFCKILFVRCLNIISYTMLGVHNIFPQIDSGILIFIDVKYLIANLLCDCTLSFIPNIKKHESPLFKSNPTLVVKYSNKIKVLLRGHQIVRTYFCCDMSCFVTLRHFFHLYHKTNCKVYWWNTQEIFYC